MYKCGSIILLNNKKGVFPFLVRLFTGTNYTHNAITMGGLIPGSESILTAELLITTHPLQRYFDNKNYEFSIFEIQGISERDLEEMVLEIYKDRVSRGYAFWQNLWFIYRRAAELLGFDVRKQGNWFPKNDNCSEETYDLLKIIAEKKNMKTLLGKLNEWNSNCFAPHDFKTIADQFPGIFKFAGCFN